MPRFPFPLHLCEVIINNSGRKNEFQNKKGEIVLVSPKIFVKTYNNAMCNLAICSHRAS